MEGFCQGSGGKSSQEAQVARALDGIGEKAVLEIRDNRASAAPANGDIKCCRSKGPRFVRSAFARMRRSEAASYLADNGIERNHAVRLFIECLGGSPECPAVRQQGLYRCGKWPRPHDGPGHIVFGCVEERRVRGLGITDEALI